MKGGARARSGPAPDPDALARDRDEGEWKVLPASGRVGDLPAWPFADVSDRERVLWADMWSRPQAIMWERQRQELEVALYVRRFAEAELPGSATTLSTLVRQLSEGLGLSVPGLLRNKWRIEEKESDSRPSASKPRSRDRFTVVTGGVA